MTTYALIPGGGGDPWEWHRLVLEPAGRDHEAIPVRLPAEDDTAGWSDHADAVVDAIGDRNEVIVVAASMGGFTAPIVCTRHPVELLVLVNAMIPVPGETFNEWWSNIGSGPARRGYHAGLGLSPSESDDDAVIYYDDLQPDLRAEALTQAWQGQSATLLTEPLAARLLAQSPDPSAGRSSRSDVPARVQRKIARNGACQLI